jgi:predicted dehydrogenase
VGEPLTIGLVGCGNISRQYLATIDASDDLELVAVTDVDPARAAAVAAGHGARAVSVDAFDDVAGVEWVLNLTTPGHHEAVALAAVAAGRHVYNEKPLCNSVAQARRVLDAASVAGTAVGCAPDTVLGTGVQTARAVIERGDIGRPVWASATMATPGHERWHPAPDFYYLPGGGPLLDMGPYYLTALVHLLGPVASVHGSSSRTRDERVLGTGPRAGDRIPVTVASHVAAVCEHASGALTTLIMSFDGAATLAPKIEVHGEQGSLAVPDPNHFGGTVRLHPVGGAWEDVTPCAGYLGAGRGVGLMDVARGGDRRTSRASAEVAFHVLDVMETILAAADRGTTLQVGTTCTVPPRVELAPMVPAPAETS